MKEEKAKINISKKINERLKENKVKMRSKWFFVAEKLGLESSFVLSALLAIIFISLAFYVMQQNGVFEFAEFGPGGWRIILENIPYDLVALAVIFFLIANYIIKQFDFSYKHPFYLFSCGSLLVIGFLAFAVFWTGVGQAVFNNPPPKLASFYQKKITYSPKGQKAVIGRVVGSGSNVIVLQTPQNKIIRIHLKKPIESPFEQSFSQGQIIKIIGQKEGDQFKAQLIRLLKKNQQRYFRTLPAASEEN